MFKHLYALAQAATLMITATAEDDLLRITITPTSNDDKKKTTLKPLSLIATPDELEAEFGNVIAAWQAPRKSLMDQVADAKAADDDDGEESEKSASTQKPAAKPAVAKTAKRTDKPAPTPKAKPDSKAASKNQDAAKAVLNPAAQWPFPCAIKAADTMPSEAAETKSAEDGTADGAPAIDPRQTSLIDPPASDAGAGESTETPAAEPVDAQQPAAAAPTNTDPETKTTNFVIAGPAFEIDLF